MKIIPQLTVIGNYGCYGCANVYRAENNNSPAFKSVLYNPNSIIYKTNPALKFMDSYFIHTIEISRKSWHITNKELQPYLKVVDIENKKNPHVRMWDINNGNKKKYAVILHGISNNISSLQEMYKKIINNTEYAILAPEYHGLTPENNENIYIEPKNILRDTKNSIEYLNKKGIENNNITVIGHCFGGFVASMLAKEYSDLENLILITPINTSRYVSTKIQENKNKHIPQSVINTFGKKHVVLDKLLKLFFNTTKQLKKVKSPVDIIYANSDQYTNINDTINMAYHCKNFRSLKMVDGFHAMDENKINAIVSILNSNKSN